MLHIYFSCANSHSKVFTIVICNLEPWRLCEIAH